MHNSGIYEFLFQKYFFNIKYIPAMNLAGAKSKLKHNSQHLKTISSFNIFCFMFTKSY